MKAKYLFLSLLIILVASCKKADGYFDALLISGTETQSILRCPIEDGEELEIPISVTATVKVESDVEVTMAFDAELVDRFNEIYGTFATLLPKEAYDYDNTELSIKAGNYISNPMTITIDNSSLIEDNKQYVLPVKIESAKGGFEPLESARVVYVFVTKVTEAKAVKVSGGQAFKYTFPAEDQFIYMSSLTFEGKVKFDNFSNSLNILTLWGLEENFLLRLGAAGDIHQLQVATAHYFSLPREYDFQENIWYHVAVTFDGATIKAYINGQLAAANSAPLGTVNISDSSKDGFGIGVSANGRTINGGFSEVRIWKTERTANEIANYMCGVDADHPDLVAYWKFDGTDEVGGKIKDQTGNGHDMNRRYTTREFVWEDIKCGK